MALPFDTILVDEGEGSQRMTVDQFMALALSTRVRLVMSGSVSFYGKGRLIARGEALSALQQENIKRARLG